jgi:hypothetical protein
MLGQAVIFGRPGMSDSTMGDDGASEGGSLGN